MVAHAPVGLGVFDLDQRALHVNPAFVRMAGLGTADHRGRYLAELVASSAATCDAAFAAVVATLAPVALRDGAAGLGGTGRIDLFPVPGGHGVAAVGVVIATADAEAVLAGVGPEGPDPARASARRELLASMGTVFEGDLDPVARARYLARTAVPVLGDHALVFLHDRAGDVLEVVAAAHVDAGLDSAMAALAGRSVDAGGPSAPATAFRRGTTTVRPFQQEYALARALADDAPDIAEALASGTSMAVPLENGGLAIGVLYLGQGRDDAPYGPADVGLAEELARLGAPAIANAVRYQREVRTGEVLQRSLLPRAMIEVPGVWSASRYLPGTVGLRVGGDWFDVVDGGPAGVLLAIGDVAGHGIDAAVSMGRFRTVLQFAATQTTEPAGVLQRINEFMSAAFRSEMATLCIVHYQPATGVAVAASAGHLPPVLIGPHGEVRVTTVPPGLPLCVDADARYHQWELPVEPGSIVVLYTDGLVERRGEVLDDGLARLVAEAAGPPAAPGAVVERVINRLVPAGGADDDVAVLVARFTVAGRRLALVFAADASALAAVRRDVRAWLSFCDVAVGRADDMVLAVSEAAANAVEHAYPGSAKGLIGVDGEVDEGGDLVVRVRDTGRWRPPRPTSNRGRGLGLMRALVDIVVVEQSDDGTEVELRVRPGSQTWARG